MTAAESLGAEKLRPRGLDSLEIVRIGSEGEGRKRQAAGLRGWTPGRGLKSRAAGWRCALRGEGLAVPDRLGAPEPRPAVGQMERRIGNGGKLRKCSLKG